MTDLTAYASHHQSCNVLNQAEDRSVNPDNHMQFAVHNNDTLHWCTCIDKCSVSMQHFPAPACSSRTNCCFTLEHAVARKW